MTWPTCPTCRQPMWTGHVGAPLRVVHGCAGCSTRTQVWPREAEQLELFDDEEPAS